ncbi:MAG: hypothetical protein ACRCUY_00875 [Thermoguttaceae bacterium]
MVDIATKTTTNAVGVVCFSGQFVSTIIERLRRSVTLNDDGVREHGKTLVSGTNPVGFRRRINAGAHTPARNAGGSPNKTAQQNRRLTPVR